jgi:uncharacterized protein
VADEAMLALATGAVLALLTAPVGVSGAVFLLPVQVSLFDVPSPAVTPTNLLYNVVSGPGSLLRYGLRRGLIRPLTGALLLGTVPGVLIGAVVRVYTVPGESAFRLIAAGLLLPLGGWLCARAVGWDQTATSDGAPPRMQLVGIGLVVGVVGGVYGIGGGSLIGPILVVWGMSVTVVAPAAIMVTFVTSTLGLVAYLMLGLSTATAVEPAWTIGICAGLGGLIGGYVGAWLQPYLPQRALTMLLGVMAAGIAVAYVVQGVT